MTSEVYPIFRFILPPVAGTANDQKHSFIILEFICGMGLMTHGNPEQKLRAAFRMCDLDNNGCITKWELESVITVSFIQIMVPFLQKLNFEGYLQHDRPVTQCQR